MVTWSPVFISAHLIVAGDGRGVICQRRFYACAQSVCLSVCVYLGQGSSLPLRSVSRLIICSVYGSLTNTESYSEKIKRGDRSSLDTTQTRTHVLRHDSLLNGFLE